jgi:phospholipase C
MNGFALNNAGRSVNATAATTQHQTKSQRWVAHQLASGGKEFAFSSAVDGTFIGSGMALVANQSAATVFTVGDLGNGAGYALSTANQYLTVANDGSVGLAGSAAGFSVFSVTYSS